MKFSNKKEIRKMVNQINRKIHKFQMVQSKGLGINNLMLECLNNKF